MSLRQASIGVPRALDRRLPGRFGSGSERGDGGLQTLATWAYSRRASEWRALPGHGLIELILG